MVHQAAAMETIIPTYPDNGGLTAGIARSGVMTPDNATGRLESRNVGKLMVSQSALPTVQHY